jgi:hypothetical protein
MKVLCLTTHVTLEREDKRASLKEFLFRQYSTHASISVITPQTYKIAS